MKTVIITLLLTAASVMSCKPPMPPTDNESACTSSCKQDQRTADVIGEADIITGIASDDFPPFSYKAIISSSNARMDYMLLWVLGSWRS